MNDQTCLIEGCKGGAYGPAGTGALCKDHFLDFVKWRRKRGQAFVDKYAGQTMEERDPIVEEWKKTVKVEEAAQPTSPLKR